MTSTLVLDPVSAALIREGVLHVLTFSEQPTCPMCDGTGSYFTASVIETADVENPCPDCDGSGWLRVGDRVNIKAGNERPVPSKMQIAWDGGLRYSDLRFDEIRASASIHAIVRIVAAFANEELPYLRLTSAGQLKYRSGYTSPMDLSDQLPYIEATPGRWAVILDDIEAAA